MLGLLLLGTGCQTALREEGVPLSQVLASPYALRLAVMPESARPGEQVTVTVEFANTGGETLWVPRQREVFLGYRNDWVEADSGSSSCDGILHVRLRPGESVRYVMPFEVPVKEGRIEIFATVRRDLVVPLHVTRNPARSGAAAPSR